MLRLLLIIPLALLSVLVFFAVLPFLIVWDLIQVVRDRIVFWSSTDIQTKQARVLGKWKGHTEVLVFSVDGTTITFRPGHMPGCMLISRSEIAHFSVPEGTIGTLITRAGRFVSFTPDL